MARGVVQTQNPLAAAAPPAFCRVLAGAVAPHACVHQQQLALAAAAAWGAAILPTGHRSAAAAGARPRMADEGGHEGVVVVGPCAAVAAA